MQPQDPNQQAYPPQPSEQPLPEPPQQPQPTMHNPLSVMQEGERVIFELKRHPIGILGIYFMTGVVLIVLAVMTFGIAPDIFTSVTKDQVFAIGGVAYLLFAVLCLLFNFIATTVYWGNQWILTSDSITQITRISLFKKESSQLGLHSLEDVTAEKHGILPTLFNYGMLKAETAGHRSKFIFNYCPNPTYYAQKILETREQMVIASHRRPQPPAQPQPQPEQPTYGQPPQA